jgi:hypothetical protein
MKLKVTSLGALCGLAVSGNAVACSSCGCTLNSDWSSQGYTTESGLSMDLRYDYFSQSQLRSGASSVSRATIAIPADVEVQQSTINRNLILGLDYSPNRNWGLDVQVPYFARPHRTIAAGDTDESASYSSGLGDVRIMARYQGFESDLSFGVQWGLKLATGDFNDRFRTGPQSGQIVDRGLQLGTGTTDLLFGVYTARSFGGGFAYFGNALWQQPLAGRDGFKPGAGANLSFGVRYSGTLTRRLTPQLQVNARIERRESGPNADVPDSGASLVYLSPGVGFALNAHLDGFAFVQLPVYQRVNGLQLEPRTLISVGFRARF